MDETLRFFLTSRTVVGFLVGLILDSLITGRYIINKGIKILSKVVIACENDFLS